MAASSQLPSLNELINKNLKRGRELFYADLDLDLSAETGVNEAGWVLRTLHYAR